jgi:hypothetical protein
MPLTYQATLFNREGRERLHSSTHRPESYTQFHRVIELTGQHEDCYARLEDKAYSTSPYPKGDSYSPVRMTPTILEEKEIEESGANVDDQKMRP